MIRIMITLTPRPAHSDSVSCREWGVGEGRDKGRALPRVRGPFGPCPWRVHLSPRLPSPGSQCLSFMIVYAWSPVPPGCLQEPVAAQASGVAGSLVGPGLSWRAGPLLPPAGLASALLHRAGAKQGSEGTIRWGATTLHLEVGSQGGVLARAPLGGGQGIMDPNHVLQNEDSFRQDLEGFPQLLHPLTLVGRKRPGSGPFCLSVPVAPVLTSCPLSLS